MKYEKTVCAIVLFGAVLFGFILGAVVFSRSTTPDFTGIDSGVGIVTDNIESAGVGIDSAQGSIDNSIGGIEESIGRVDRISGLIEESGSGIDRAIDLARILEAGLFELQGKE